MSTSLIVSHTPREMSSVDVSSNLTFDGSNALYSKIKKVPADELRTLLSRGSGHIVKGGRKRKAWFQAQCAHYGLSTQGTLAELRRRLDETLGHPPARAPQQLMLEREGEVDGNSGIISINLEFDIPLLQAQVQAPIHIQVLPEISGADSSNQTTERRTSASSPPGFISPPVGGESSRKSVSFATSTPRKGVVPQARPSAKPQSDKSTRRASELDALEQIKFMMQQPGPTDPTETERYGGFDTDYSTRLRRTLTRSGARSSSGSALVTRDIVSGRWELQVKEHSMPSMPAPWRPASLKGLQGDINAHLSDDKRSLSAEFALLGMDGMFRSRKVEQRPDGVYIEVQFVAQMPLTTAKPGRRGDIGYNLIFGPSKTQNGHLMFFKDGTVRGTLRCRNLGAVEFTGVMTGELLDFVTSWASFVE